MKCSLLFFLILPGLLAAQPNLLPEHVRETEPARAVLDRNYIHITGKGRVGVPYPQALVLMKQADLLLSVQEAYADLLEEGAEPEFEITLDAPGQYSYVNQKDQRTDISELTREAGENGETILVLYSKGKRSFGRFEALIHVTVTPDPEHEDESSRWEVQVFAFPQNGISRFLARNFGMAQRYFTRKTAEISELVTDICLHLIEIES